MAEVGAVVVRHGTVLPMGVASSLLTDVLVVEDRVTAIEAGLEAPPGAEEIMPPDLPGDDKVLDNTYTYTDYRSASTREARESIFGESAGA